MGFTYFHYVGTGTEMGKDMKFQYLLFDLDGTLTDPKEGITTSVQYALHSFGIEEPDLDKLMDVLRKENT